MRPVSSSRARNLIMYLPGSSVKPVSYSMGRWASSRGSRVRELDVQHVANIRDGGAADMSLISPMKSISVCSAPPRLASASSLPGNLHRRSARNIRRDSAGNNSISIAIVSSVIGIVEHQRIFELPLLVDGRELARIPCRRK